LSSSIPLTHAVTSGNESAVTALLANGVDVNETTSGGQTPLILAVIFGHTNLVELLVRAGADPEVRDNLGLNAIEWARRRGATDALNILTNPPAPGTARKITVKAEEPARLVVDAPPPAPATETKDSVSPDEKSRQWIAGLKQRLNEQEVRRLNRNEPRPEPPRPVEEPAPPVLPAPPVRAASKEPPARQTINPPKPEKPQPVTNHKPIATPSIATPAIEPPSQAPSSTGKRKRCPKCNATYNNDLLFYCAHHIVPLVDDEGPIISEPPKETTPLFWIILVITLSASVAVGSLITTYLYSNEAPREAAPQPLIQKGVPELGGELVGKAVSLPEAECPIRGPEPVSGTVTVHVKVDKDGKVNLARGSGGDWLMRGASTEAAMKSTFAPEKLRRRETEGTITYTFKPD
jgi:Ankyrin repeats (3 copies)